jgi:hypothetical protein
MSMRSRTELRRHLSVEDRAGFLEEDIDRLESAIGEGLKELNRKLGRYTQALIGVLVSVTTAAVIMVLQLASARGR